MLKKLLFLLLPIIGFSQNVILSDDAKVSILTCGTAQVSYTMYGHTGIRITDNVNQIDVVYNYGAFDFSTPNFMMKFVKGDLQYFVTSENYYDFEYNYKLDGRSIVSQELNLTTVQKQQLLNELNTSLTSNERFYTYKFIDKNCTTMVVDKINKILGEQIIKQPKSEQSYREILYPYMSDFYMKLGIQIIFGTKVDQSATRLFLPLELEKALNTASQNGKKNRKTYQNFKYRYHHNAIFLYKFYIFFIGRDCNFDCNKQKRYSNYLFYFCRIVRFIFQFSGIVFSTRRNFMELQYHVI